MNLDLKFYREFEAKIAEQVEAQSLQLLDGKALTFDDYRNRVGRIRGLRDALEIAKEVNASVIGVDRKSDR